MVPEDGFLALTAMKALPKHLLIRLAGPYCVAGCLAEGSIRKDFRQLLSETRAEGHTMGQLWNALDLMEEFWKIRESMVRGQHIEGSPWVLAMTSTETKTLLI